MASFSRQKSTHKPEMTKTKNWEILFYTIYGYNQKTRETRKDNFKMAEKKSSNKKSEINQAITILCD